MKIGVSFVRLARNFFTLLILCVLIGCVRNPFLAENFVLTNDKLQVPHIHQEQEVMIMRINQTLNQHLSQKMRSDLLFERGVLYDSLGLWELAHYDFIHALTLQPKNPAIYNYLGLYWLLDNNYSIAVEALNGVLELDPDYEFAHFNLGLTFYYMERFSLAEQNLLRFYERDKSNPYAVLWLYFNELKFSPTSAKENLVKRSTALSPQSWGTYIVQHYLGQLSITELWQKSQSFVKNSIEESAKFNEILTETYFYLAKQQLNIGQTEKAKQLFKLAIANQVYNFVEYRFALLEAAKLGLIQAKSANGFSVSP